MNYSNTAVIYAQKARDIPEKIAINQEQNIEKDR